MPETEVMNRQTDQHTERILRVLDSLRRREGRSERRQDRASQHWLTQGRKRAHRMQSMTAPRKEDTQDAVDDCPKEREHKGCGR